MNKVDQAIWEASNMLAEAVRNTWRLYNADTESESCRYCLKPVSPARGVRHDPNCPVLATDIILGVHEHFYRGRNFCKEWTCARPKKT